MNKNLYHCGEEIFSALRTQSKDYLDGLIFFLAVFDFTAEYKRMKYVLEKLGVIVEVIKISPVYWDEQLRRASLLGDFIYVENSDFWSFGRVPCIDPEKDINGILGRGSMFSDCRSFGVMNYLLYCCFDLNGKNVVIEDEDTYLLEKLNAARATVTVINPYTREKYRKIQEADLIITSPKKEGIQINMYPRHCPVIDMRKHCINCEDRDVIQNGYWLFNLIGVLAQIW